MKADAKILDQLYIAENPAKIGEIYNQWAISYDQDVNHDADYEAPSWCMRLLERYVPDRNARLLDAGAGTGLFGELLYAHGYKDVVGIDVSEGMLEKARVKNVYRSLHKKVLGTALDFDNDSFDAVASVGVFSPGQGPHSAFEELIRITKPGGIIMYTLRPHFYDDDSTGFKDVQLALEVERRWSLEQKTEKFQGLPKSEPDFLYNIWVYRVV